MRRICTACVPAAGNGAHVLLGGGDDRGRVSDGHPTVEGGAGDDRFDLWWEDFLDDDTVFGDAGDDRINVVGGGRDTVDCGDGTDVVFADASDVIAPDCEDVRM